MFIEIQYRHMYIISLDVRVAIGQSLLKDYRPFHMPLANRFCKKCFQNNEIYVTLNKKKVKKISFPQFRSDVSSEP